MVTRIGRRRSCPPVSACPASRMSPCLLEGPAAYPAARLSSSIAARLAAHTAARISLCLTACLSACLPARPAAHLAAVLLVVALLAWVSPGIADDAEGIPQEMLDAIRAEAADRIIFEDEHGILLVDTNFKPKRIYDQQSAQDRNILRETVYRDLIGFMADGDREMVGLLLLIKSGAFAWPGDLRFQAIVEKKGRVVAAVPMEFAVFALVESEEKLVWFELGTGERRTLVPRDDRLVPTQLKEIPQIYRIYMLFPARIEIDGEYQRWDVLKLSEVSIEPMREEVRMETAIESAR